jgi:hypothetical protein
MRALDLSEFINMERLHDTILTLSSLPQHRGFWRDAKLLSAPILLRLARGEAQMRILEVWEHAI